MNAIEEVTNYPDEDPEKTLSAIDSLVMQDNKSYIDNFIVIFDKTQNNSIRNSLALVLSDWNVSDVVPIIIKFIKEGSKDQIGTLVYALSNFHYEMYLNDILSVLETGNFEAKEMVIQLLENLPDSVDDSILSNARKTLTDLIIRNVDPEVDRYLIYASELLEEYN
jgi:HEAT repeat protein